jgi:glycosyltransferase involved in cell wall biosynthesis
MTVLLMGKISATVVTLNEEDQIRNCLKSVSWCDEIIIVDSHSEDATVEIAKEFTDKIYTYERTGYVEPARQKALSEASGDWILMLDADERVPKSLSSQLRELSKDNQVDVVFAPRMNYMFGEWINYAGWWPDYRAILYKPSVVEITTQIHNGVNFTEDAEKRYLGSEKESAVIHYNYKDIYDFISRMNKYTDIEAQQSDFSYLKLITSPTKEFINRYLLNKGYKGGIIGLSLSIFMSWYRFLSAIKSWQYEHLGNEDQIISKYDKIDRDMDLK